jgi:hypothetical protein
MRLAQGSASGTLAEVAVGALLALAAGLTDAFGVAADADAVGSSDGPTSRCEHPRSMSRAAATWTTRGGMSVMIASRIPAIAPTESR